tara:strand:+ start:26084 stop:26239 length:156 start_codon:yes stop_codon:yes gene_type:complete
MLPEQVKWIKEKHNIINEMSYWRQKYEIIMNNLNICLGNSSDVYVYKSRKK